MLIEFSVANYLSFDKKKTLSMQTADIDEYNERIIKVGKHKILPSAAIYGANSSGKSNLIKAMKTMRNIVINNLKKSSISEIDVTHFLLNSENQNQPSFFEIIFLIENIKYRYGFEVDRKTVKAEWLFQTIKTKEEYLFIRENGAIGLSPKFKEGEGLEKKTRDNALFLSVVDFLNGEISTKVITWFGYFSIISGIEHKQLKSMTDILLQDNNEFLTLLKFFKDLDLGFENIEIEKIEEEIKIYTKHKKYNSNGDFIENINFDLRQQESSGTNKIFDLAGFIFGTLNLGFVLVIDELDAKLHPLLTLSIIKMFNIPELNKKNAQLIFATHDTNILKYGNFRRDQVYFTEKNKFEATDLYSLVEFKQNDINKSNENFSFETDYISGKYGAIPFIGNFKNIFENGKND